MTSKKVQSTTAMRMAIAPKKSKIEDKKHPGITRLLIAYDERSLTHPGGKDEKKERIEKSYEGVYAGVTELAKSMKELRYEIIEGKKDFNPDKDSEAEEPTPTLKRREPPILELQQPKKQKTLPRKGRKADKNCTA